MKNICYKIVKIGKAVTFFRRHTLRESAALCCLHCSSTQLPARLCSAAPSARLTAQPPCATRRPCRRQRKLRSLSQCEWVLSYCVFKHVWIRSIHTNNFFSGRPLNMTPMESSQRRKSFRLLRSRKFWSKKLHPWLLLSPKVVHRTQHSLICKCRNFRGTYSILYYILCRLDQFYLS